MPSHTHSTTCTSTTTCLIQPKYQCIIRTRHASPWLFSRHFTNGGVILTEDNIHVWKELLPNESLYCGMRICRWCYHHYVRIDTERFIRALSQIPSVIAQVEKVNMNITISDLDRTRNSEMYNDNLVDLGILYAIIVVVVFIELY
jgi:hypothetical protein